MSGMIVKSNPIRIVGVRTGLKEIAEENLKIILKFWQKNVDIKQYKQIGH